METALKKELIVNKYACRMLGVLTFVILTALGAFVRIPLPFTPVPITLQTFFVLLSGSLLGSGLGAVSQASYIFLGVLGFPVFTGAGAGLSYLAGPTGGYIAGFFLASLFIGKMIKYSKDNFLLTVFIFYSAELLILLSGAAWLKVILGSSFNKTLAVGFVPFLAIDLAKAIIASSLYLKLKSRAEEVF